MALTLIYLFFILMLFVTCELW